MATENPFVGGPDYPRYLATSINNNEQQLYCPAPPASGGQQISIRLQPDRVVLLDILSDGSGWSRNQIIQGLLDAAFGQLFHNLTDEAAQSVMKQSVDKIIGK